jgi:hypothetical protein
MRVSRRRRQAVGGRCPTLAANAKHGWWFFEVYVPIATGGRKQLRRGSWATKREAEAELRRVLNRRDRDATKNHRMTPALQQLRRRP